MTKEGIINGKRGRSTNASGWEYETRYWHFTLKTGDNAIVDHGTPGWMVKEWISLRDNVADALANGQGFVSLPGALAAFVSSVSGSDGQMSFNILDPRSKDTIVYGTYCADPSVELAWWGSLLQAYRGSGGWLPADIENTLPSSEDVKPWLAVGYEYSLELLFGGHPLTWCQYEQLLVDAWQVMTSTEKAGLRARHAQTGRTASGGASKGKGV